MTDLQARWQTLAAAPLRFVDPAALNACLDDALPADELAALLAQPRFAPRLLARLHKTQALAPLAEVAPEDPRDLQVLTLAVEDLPRLPLFCGALWHGVALAREIRGDAVARLKLALGADAFAFAVAGREHARATDCLLDGERLLAAIRHDGQACLDAWLHSRPEPLRRWLALRWPAWTAAVPTGDPALRLTCLYRAAAALMPPEQNA